MKYARSVLLIAVLVMMVGCATAPPGPSVRVLPTPGKPFEIFQQEDAYCRMYAQQQTGMTPQQVANQNTATGAVAGTVIGAGLGAAIGAATGNPGAGAAIGAGSGLAAGTIAGAHSGQMQGYEAQRTYDIAYQQCMYAKGNQVPGMAPNPQGAYPAPPPPPPTY